MPATAAQILQDYSLDVRLLTVDTFGAPNRTVTKATVTNKTAVSVGATSLSLFGDTAISLKAGNALSFISAGGTLRQQAILTQDVASLPITNATAINVSVLPIKRAIGALATALEPSGMIPLAGIQQMDFNNQETMVDTTSFGSGSGTEGIIVRVQRQLTINGITLPGDEAMETVIKPVAGLTSALMGREIYVIATKPNGEIFEGAAMVSALNFPANQNEVDKYSFTLSFQGNTFAWTRPYTF